MATFLHECEPGALRSSLTCAGLTSVSKPTRPTVFIERAELDGLRDVQLEGCRSQRVCPVSVV